MRTNYFISVFIAVALCFGQLASNAHILNHLGMADDHAEAGHYHQNGPVLHIEALVGEAHDDESFDCGIYHTFAGSNCLSSIPSCDSVARFECVIVSTIPSLLLPSDISASPHIRGPPQYS